ncbi:MAG: class D sortase [Acidimicrobiales bacterium]|nr:class D sortase [Acidimicrobiales bacterium]
MLTSMPVTAALTSVATPKGRSEPRQISYSQNPSAGDILGSLSIPTLDQEFLVIEGTRKSDLKRGVGHYAKSVMPGQKDNCVLSAHRDTFFSKLGELKKGDRMTLETATGSYTYEVKRTRIVGKDNRTVIVPTKHGVLTLTTCYPFEYVGSAPKRYIVSADLVP